MIDDISDVYQLLSSGMKDLPTRKQTILLRKAELAKCMSTGFEKVAFDTRRINQETDYIPRRGLQNYHRSEKFISDTIAEKVSAFKKLSNVLDTLKLQYGRNPEWHDSYTRVLASAVHRGLRTIEADDDFSDAQPSMASLDYLEELMYVRYRMTAAELSAISEEKLRDAILSKDELLVKSGFDPMDLAPIKPSEISKNSYEDMFNKMMVTMAKMMESYKPIQIDGRADKPKETTEQEKTITISIKV